MPFFCCIKQCLCLDCTSAYQSTHRSIASGSNRSESTLGHREFKRTLTTQSGRSRLSQKTAKVIGTLTPLTPKKHTILAFDLIQLDTENRAVAQNDYGVFMNLMVLLSQKCDAPCARRAVFRMSRYLLHMEVLRHVQTIRVPVHMCVQLRVLLCELVRASVL